MDPMYRNSQMEAIRSSTEVRGAVLKLWLLNQATVVAPGTTGYRYDASNFLPAPKYHIPETYLT